MQRDWIIQNSFSKVLRLFSHFTQSVLLILLQGYFKSIPPYSWTYDEVKTLFIKWMASQAYNNNHIILFPLQIWNQPHWIKCSDQFRVNKRDTGCFEHPHEENTKPSVNVSVSHMPEFSYQHRDFYGFYRGEGRNDGTLIEWERDVDVLVAIFSPLILVEKSVVKIQKQQSRGDMKSNKQEWN